MKTLLLSISALALLGACSAQTATEMTKDAAQAADVMPERVVTPEVARLQKLARESTHAYDITESLTTEIGPRLAGTEEEARARDWAMAKMAELGFENIRNEPFMVPGWIRGVETAEILSPNPQQLFITSLGGAVATPPEGIEADIAYFPTFEDLKNAPMGGLDGKIVFISGRMEKAPDGAGYGPANQKRRSGATEAGKRGAAAVIIRSVGTDSHRFPHTGQMRYAEDVAPIPIGALSAPDADQLERTLDRGETVRIKLTMTPRAVGELPSGNVIGEIVGTEKPEEIIIISGHLDSWDLGTGALDDGAGIGIAFGAAKVLMESGLKPKRTIRVIAYGAEEIGLKGGFAYADKHADDLDNHVLASQSDFGAGPVYEVRSGVKGAAGNAVLKDIAKALGLPMSEKPTNGGPDIGPIFNKGVPAMRLQQDGTDYFDYHHTPDDTFDKIDPEHMAQNVEAWVTMLWMASEADTDFRE
ncbi:M20/M25/M40 family metallo-hydrolase [Fretibacter rubidus]|uniref:M20/M25/M40 family metallo-hydrolase n=1 Tax=Fretibacter rubidus TaxID=570162 RepID=UPI00352B963D